MNSNLKLILFLCFLFLVSLSYAQEETKVVKPIPTPASFETNHEGIFGGQKIRYKAIAKETYLTGDDYKAVASFWSVSYLREGVEDATNRPVCFVFNGGPGSASVWLHMGLLGPQMVKVNSDGSEDDGAAPYPIVNNKHGLLDQTDLVFIDPIGTGYSQVVGKGEEKDYWGMNEDASSISKFIRMWVNKHQRWNSPKYIIGESFGTTRSVTIAKELEGGGQSMALNGLVMISQALDFSGSTPMHHNVISYVNFLPTMAAIAWYHQKAGKGKTLEAFVEESRNFAYQSYASALLMGESLSQEEQNTIAEQLAYFTGLEKAYILRSKLRILRSRFQMKLLADQGLAVGALDGRYTGDEYDKVADKPDLGDPTMYQIGAAYTTALNHYFASKLQVNMSRPYITSNAKLSKKWKYRDVADDKYYEPKFVNVAPMLGDVMRRNKDLKVLVAMGYYDLVTPFADAEYTFRRNGIVQDRVTMTYYEGGHMMYTHEPDLIRLLEDIRSFLAK